MLKTAGNALLKTPGHLLLKTLGSVLLKTYGYITLKNDTTPPPAPESPTPATGGDVTAQASDKSVSADKAEEQKVEENLAAQNASPKPEATPVQNVSELPEPMMAVKPARKSARNGARAESADPK